MCVRDGDSHEWVLNEREYALCVSKYMSFVFMGFWFRCWVLSCLLNFNAHRAADADAAACFTRIITLFMADLTVISGVILRLDFFGLKMNLNWNFFALVFSQFRYVWLLFCDLTLRCVHGYWTVTPFCPSTDKPKAFRYKLLCFIISHAKRVHATSNFHHRCCCIGHKITRKETRHSSSLLSNGECFMHGEQFEYHFVAKANASATCERASKI